jgi:hypothetical protein
MQRVRLFLALAALLAPGLAMAQSVKVVDPSTGLPVFSSANPAPVSMVSSVAQRFASTVTNGSVATANTFQSALAASSTRNGCLLQNTSANTLLVFLGSAGSATSANSLQIGAGGTLNCRNPGGLIVTDEISVTSTVQGTTFVLAVQ